MIIIIIIIIAALVYTLWKSNKLFVKAFPIVVVSVIIIAQDKRTKPLLAARPSHWRHFAPGGSSCPKCRVASVGLGVDASLVIFAPPSSTTGLFVV